MKDLRINAERFRHDFDALAEIGATGDGGVSRPTFSEAHLTARAWFRQRIIEDGFEFCEDGVGNHSAVLHAANPEAKTLVLGSHLDSVPNGGRFDGALGVLSAYEVLRTVRDAGLMLPVHLEAIDFTDEEGTLVGLLGSRAFTNSLPKTDLVNPRGGVAALQQGMVRAGLTSDGMLAARRAPDTLLGFLEVHIEQGSRLIDAQADIGVVTSIVGIRSYELTFVGRADHAGTTPMHERRDAGLGAATMMSAARDLVMTDFPDCVVNTGQISFAPGAYNIVPAQAVLGVEFRAPTDEKLTTLQHALLACAKDAAAQHDLELHAKLQGCITASPCAPTVQDAFHAASRLLGLASMALASGAGHDTMALAQVCPAGMIFIPSTNGSHNPDEFATWDACVNGANTLLHAALILANQ